jgi:hypothetical protein
LADCESVHQLDADRHRELLFRMGSASDMSGHSPTPVYIFSFARATFESASWFDADRRRN